uniref:hypothetical protein n=1 Tax=Halomonas sp. TaxID=1486246 RepID=UPI00262FEB5F|nr:hypothetical protein [Halomonas sp.]
MKELMLVSLFFVGLVIAWRFVNNKLKHKGRGFLVRHFSGSIAGTIFGFFIFIIAFAIFGPEPDSSEVKTASTNDVEVQEADQPNIASLYTIVSDKVQRPYKRTVEVKLHQRVDEPTLELIGKAIKSNGDQGVDRTFIGYRLDGQNPGSSYWGTTHYNPDLNVSISGLNPDEFDALQRYDISDKYENILGSWVIERGFNYLAVAYKKDGNYYIDDVFPGEGVNTTSYGASELDDGTLRLQKHDDEFGEYFVIDKTGSLQFWSENGNYFTAKPRNPNESKS